MDIKKEYERWLVNATADTDVADELKTLDDTKIEDAFYRDLAFGTGGLRGVIGAGTNRMNVYTVAKASQGLADYLKKNFTEPSVAIGYDSRMIDFEDYRDLFNKYDTLTKISFDYAVVEKESSIQVLRYSGDWKDVGTWNMMAEVMADKTKGKAILDETCENTNVVNELNIPILCMGCKDMIVAASGDGILIADKERSGYMKPYVEKIETEAMYAEKSWGTYTVIDVQPGSMTVKISMRAGEHMTYHMHNYREEVWTVVSGKGKAIVDGMEQVLRTGDVITIAAGCKHTVEAITALDMIEVQLGEEISVTDKIKFPMD